MVELDLDGLGRTVFCHGSPRSDTEIITPITSDERLREILRDLDPAVVVCGHTHQQFDRAVERPDRSFRRLGVFEKQALANGGN